MERGEELRGVHGAAARSHLDAEPQRGSAALPHVRRRGEAIQCGLDHRADALEYALQFGRGIDAAVADRFVSMYVNDLTKDYGDEGRKAVTELLRRGEALHAFPEPVHIDFV